MTPSTSPSPLIFLTDYDPSWPVLFAEEAPQIASALGLPRTAVQHVGSTSVPGLRSKPLIDMVVSVPSLKQKEDYLSILAPLGYSYREVNDPGRLFYEKRQANRFHIHIVEEDGWHYWRLILFRDRLRTDALTATSYVELKRQLAELYSDNRDRYSAGKSVFVTRTVQAELRRRPELLERLRTAGAPVDAPIEHKRDPDSESMPLR